MVRPLIPFLLMLSASTMAAPRNDPTLPPSGFAPVPQASTERTDRLLLQAVINSPQRRLAIINGRSLREGERLGEWQIRSIRPREVLLVSPHGTQLLRLNFPSKPAAD
ncbi:hypothetical protein BGI27_17345 [Candidatus Dactylopiibacterium carminicum]|uniref:MSHA biogenesis protein MshK n=2 Tax=Candidatus Dactylopiibacterium carminicum TaxID=857335 RepID=A0ABQ7HKV2_9RHOO|nr:hypothetical protein [Candidatus Dactylopiibacterium carminicum]KAF7597709.1 hypothetical protein BGI27_17345 [Candidatus Dactylopiibacterium carminicum]PAS94514.1 MAG: hypothetical protein BSR46_17385 [Candidatus Dactylopiibacterium carminicum]